MSSKTLVITILCGLLLFTSAHGGNLAIVIDDFGYRKNNENQILNMSIEISIAILPNAPLAQYMAKKAHQQGREILIHLPMAPLSQQPLEKNTLLPTMSENEIQKLILLAMERVPNAKGMNNHMGSAITSSLPAMQKVMRTLASQQLYFLDSVTVAHSQAEAAGQECGVSVLKRQIFLDDNQDLAVVRQQLNQAIKLAQKQQSVIAIGHPYPSTIKALQEMLPNLPANVQLVPVSSLLAQTKIELTPQPETLENIKQICPIEFPAKNTTVLDLFTRFTNTLQEKFNVITMAKSSETNLN